MIFLIDADSLLYKSVYKIVDYQTIKQYFYQNRTKEWMEKEIIELSINRMTSIMDQIIHEIENTGIVCDSVEYFLSVCPKSKRKELYPSYKVNRKPNKWVSLCRKYLLDSNFAIHNEYWEADDLVADRARELGPINSLIVSMDKDMNTIEGVHFNFYRPRPKPDEYGFPVQQEMKGLSVVDADDAKYNFFFQMLAGDPGDYVRGIPRIGKVKAEKILFASENYEQAVSDAYKKYFKDNWQYEYDKSYYLLYLGIKDRKEPTLIPSIMDIFGVPRPEEGLTKILQRSIELTKQLNS